MQAMADSVKAVGMHEEKPNQVEQFKMPREKISKYFAPGTPAQKIEDTIIKALELWRHREGDGVSDHVGIVERADGTTVYTIEGNTSDSVARRSYALDSVKIMGYGVPIYT
jgi:hypothetical protein